MEVQFAEQNLSLLETRQAGSTGLPVGVIRSARRALTILRAAPDEQLLRGWRSLHYREISGERDGLRAIKLSEKKTMLLKLDPVREPPAITLLGIEDDD